MRGFETETELVVGGERLKTTNSEATDEAFSLLEETKARMEKHHPDKIFTIKPFHAHISKIDHITHKVTKWHKEAGYSLWEKL